MTDEELKNLFAKSDSSIANLAVKIAETNASLAESSRESDRKIAETNADLAAKIAATDASLAEKIDKITDQIGGIGNKLIKLPRHCNYSRWCFRRERCRYCQQRKRWHGGL